MPSVSIILPAYNAMIYLPETMESLLNQTFDDFEAIVVNDGSSDEIEQWVSQIQDARVKLISQNNQGLARTRNTGIAHAVGKYVAFLDADDLWEPTKLEKQVDVLEKNPEIGLVYTWVAYIDEKSEYTGKVVKYEAEGDVWKTLLERNIVECGSVAMVRRSCFDAVGVFDENLSCFNVNEDWDMWLRIAGRYPFKVVREPLAYYRQTSSSASKNWKAIEQSFCIVIEKAFDCAPPELLDLKGRSYGVANFCFAWKALQSCDRDYKRASQFRASALAHYPKLRFSKEYIRLSLAIAVMQWFGPESYERLLATFHALRRRLAPMER
ncbi:MAG TPA: glycosyltransferase family A protein [Waterburya sp.]|jgi:glycosyltransferase involved in cell wall biosynthesis